MRRDDERFDNVDKSVNDETSKLESAIDDVHHLSIEMEKARLLRDYAKEDFLREKKRAEKIGRKFTTILGSKTDQVELSTGTYAFLKSIALTLL